MKTNNSTQIELYIHIPFCVKKCDYCDFLSFPADDELKDNYVNALIKEIEVKASCVNKQRVSSIFFGGGTPSILKPLYIDKIMDLVNKSFSIEGNAEITIEANPGTLDPKKLAIYKQSGINRISIGLQSACDEELRMLGRIHSYEEFLHSYNLARKIGYNNINVDIMGALPGQTKSAFIDTLNKVIELRPEHISSYELIIEEGTPFYNKYSNGVLPLPSEDEERDIYYKTREILEANGYHQYEISNYAKDGYECRHNIGYWTGVEYLGLGLGASSYYDGVRFKNTTNIHEYILGDYARYEEDILNINDKKSEFIFLGLRMTCGISVSEYLRRFGVSIYEDYEAAIDSLIRQDLLCVEGDYIKLTYRGMDVANRVMSEFV